MIGDKYEHFDIVTISYICPICKELVTIEMTKEDFDKNQEALGAWTKQACESCVEYMNDEPILIEE